MNTQFKRWTPEEEVLLLNEISSSVPIYQIARSHDRSKKAIEIRLADIGIKLKNSGLSFDEIKTKTGLTEEQINERIKSIEEERNKTNQLAQQIPTVNTINTIIQRLDVLSNHIKMLDSTISKLSIDHQ